MEEDNKETIKTKINIKHDYSLNSFIKIKSFDIVM